MLGLHFRRCVVPNRVIATYHSNVRVRAENAALVLRELETALRAKPDAAQQLSVLLSPATTRDLSKALKSVEQLANQVAVTAESESVKTATIATVTPPTRHELKIVALHVGLPFIGFGFVDNFIMILAGDYIDLTLGVSFGISSMAAAGIGNTISDIAGLGLGNLVQDFCTRLGLPNQALTHEQMLLKQTRLARIGGSSVGVTIGCLLGMLPLLFLHTKDDKGDRPEVVGASKD